MLERPVHAGGAQIRPGTRRGPRKGQARQRRTERRGNGEPCGRGGWRGKARGHLAICKRVQRLDCRIRFRRFRDGGQKRTPRRMTGAGRMSLLRAVYARTSRGCASSSFTISQASLPAVETHLPVRWPIHSRASRCSASLAAARASITGGTKARLRE